MTYHLSQRQIIKVTNGPKKYNTNSIKNLDLNQVKNWKNLPRQMEPHVSFFLWKPNISGNFQYNTKPHKKFKQLAHNAFVIRIRTHLVYKCMLNGDMGLQFDCMLVGMTPRGSQSLPTVCASLLPTSNTNTSIQNHTSFILHHNSSTL